MRHKLVLVTVIFIVYIFYSIAFQNLNENKSINASTKDEYHELNLLFSFPKENNDTTFIAYPTEMLIDEEQSIYICDNWGNKIIKFSENGNLLKIIGCKGQGPGEFLFPSSLCTDNKGNFFVIDVNNRRIQLFDKQWNYLSSFKMIKLPHDIVHYKDEIFGITISDLEAKKHLISVYSEKGRLLREFGEYLDFSYNLTSMASKALIKFFDNKLYVLFQYYPFLKIYGLNGELVQTIEFNKLNYKELLANNYNFAKFKKGLRVYPFKFLFRAFDVTEVGIFVGLYGEDIVIDRYDFNGKFIQRFKRTHKEEKFYLFDFRVFKANESEFKFYILNKEGIPKVDVCIASSK